MDFSPSPARSEHRRRVFLKRSLAVSASVAVLGNLPRLADAAEPLSQRYPDPLVKVLDDSFLELRLFMAGSHSICALFVNTRGADLAG